MLACERALFAGSKFYYSARSVARFGERRKDPSAIFWIFLRILSVLNSYHLSFAMFENRKGKGGGGGESGICGTLL